MRRIVNTHKSFTLAALACVAVGCATTTQDHPYPAEATPEHGKSMSMAALKAAPVLVEYRAKAENIPLSRIGVLVDGTPNIGKVGPLLAGEHKIGILVELALHPSHPLAYQRDFVIRLKDAKYVKVILVASPSQDGFAIDTQLNVLDEASVPTGNTSEAENAERRLLERADPQIDRRLTVAGTFFNNLVQLCVDASGKVESETLVAPSNTLFDANVMKAMWGWRFKPLIESGEPKPFCYVQKNVLRVSL